MTKYEKLILFLIVLVLLGKFGGLALDLYIASTYGPSIPPDVRHYWEQFYILFGRLLNVGAAVWLYIEARTIALKGWVWALFGLFFGFIGLVLFYAVQIFAANRVDET